MTYQHLVAGWRQFVLIAVLLLGLLFSSLDASIISTSLVTISIDLQDFLSAPWVILSYLLAYLGFAICFAKLSDIYGRRELICAAWVLFAGSSVGCGFATTMNQLIICRAFQGMGGSGLYSLGQIVLFEVGPAHKPSLMGALVGLTLAVSYVLGPILGGIISSSTTWRWVFWINIPFGVILLAALYVAWPRTMGRRCGGWDAFRRIDFVGNILIVSACTLLVFALQEAGAYTWAWDSSTIIASLTVASLSWVTFIIWEVYLAVKSSTRIEPILPLRLVLSRVYSASVICTFCTGFVYLAILIILPERFQIVNGDNALLSGVHLLPMLGATSLGAFFAGAVSRRRNNTSWTLVAAHCLQIIGVGLLSTLSGVNTGIKAQYGFQVILGLGIGLSLGAATIMASVQARQSDLAVAQGAVAQSRVLGGSIGIAICSIVFNARVASGLHGRMDPEDLQALHHSPTIAPWLPGDIQLLVKSVYASAFADNIRVMIGVAAVGVVTSCLAYEKHPPPMPTAPQAKEVFGLDGQSETELDEFARRH
ncbi:major facilitator superfamily domain-containing protein [Xylariomycetidae sp. FL0641]|nr:major facilitator superfamily domain-containing protein [Xylariomycetidae sp. FL0641]